MECQSRIQLDIINEEEGMILLRKHTGIYNFNVSPTLDDVVKEVVRECRGLPIAIITIGSALREKSIDDWKDVFKKLKMSKFTDIETVDQNVYAYLKLSYDFLKAKETKFCFLLCSLFPEDYEIDAKEGFVKMHDLVRDVALWITSTGENVFMVNAGMRLTEWPKRQGLEQCTAISLMGNRIEMLPDDPKSRLLKIRGIEATSLVAFKALYENVEYLEWEWIKGLRDETGLNELKRFSIWSFHELECIVDMTQQQDVPSTAFSNLVDLSLNFVGLREICSGGRPPRGFLENLETLYIRDCHSMSCLFPSWVLIQRLRKLKKVTVWWCDELEEVFQLEGLCYAKQNPFLLSTLESLYLKDLKNMSLEYIVEVKEAEENVAGGGNDVMFPKLRKLQLHGLKNFINFYSENSSLNLRTAKEGLNLRRYDLQNLEELEISRCRVQVLFHLEGLEQELAFPRLEILELESLKELECLWLTHLILSTLARNLLQLESIDIDNCKELEQIIVEDHIEDDHVQLGLFPNLSSISVQGCSKLKSLFPVSIAFLLSLQNLTTLKLYNCQGPTHLFSSTLVRNLMQLEIIYIWNCKELEQIIVEDHTEDHHVQLGLFPNLSSISVKRCGKLKTLFPALTIVRSGLQKLKTINVERSSQLEELFGHKEEADMTSDREMALPRLEELTLEQLASLINFCPVGYHLIFPSLSRLEVTNCPKLTTRFSVDQNSSVHTETEARDMEQSPPETTRRIYCLDVNTLQKWLPPYIGK
ncbi:hypothetical protein QYF36_018402 [Acer negundo]|nr:hypothetical protein QYF36_018402 [Acer negundo]